MAKSPFLPSDARNMGEELRQLVLVESGLGLREMGVGWG